MLIACEFRTVAGVPFLKLRTILFCSPRWLVGRPEELYATAAIQHAESFSEHEREESRSLYFAFCHLPGNFADNAPGYRLHRWRCAGHLGGAPAPWQQPDTQARRA